MRKTKGIRNLVFTFLLCQSVGDLDRIAGVGRGDSHKFRNVCRTCGAWLVFQALVVRLDLFLVDADLNLGGKGNV